MTNITETKACYVFHFNTWQWQGELNGFYFAPAKVYIKKADFANQAAYFGWGDNKTPFDSAYDGCTLGEYLFDSFANYYRVTH